MRLIITLLLLLLFHKSIEKTTIFKYIYIRLCCSVMARVKVCYLLARDLSIPVVSFPLRF